MQVVRTVAKIPTQLHIIPDIGVGSDSVEE